MTLAVRQGLQAGARTLPVAAVAAWVVAVCGIPVLAGVKGWAAASLTPVWLILTAAGADTAAPSCVGGFPVTFVLAATLCRNLAWPFLLLPLCCLFKKKTVKKKYKSENPNKSSNRQSSSLLYLRSESVATENFWPFDPNGEIRRLLSLGAVLVSRNRWSWCSHTARPSSEWGWEISAGKTQPWARALFWDAVSRNSEFCPIFEWPGALVNRKHRRKSLIPR